MRPVAILFDRLGPYHAARLEAAARELPVAAIETSAETTEYAWDKVSAPENLQRLTLFPGTRPVNGRAIAERVESALTELQPTAVAIPGWAEPAALAAMAWCRATGTPGIVMSESTAHDAERGPVREFIKRQLIAGCSGGLVGGRLHADYLAELGMDRARIFPGYDVVDNGYFHMQAEAARENLPALRAQRNLPPRYFLASARFIEKKNLPRLLRAYRAYRDSAGAGAWSLVLLGDGPLRTELETLRDELGLAPHLQMPGFEQYDRLPGYYAAAGAFVHASTTEQWGLVVNEAMAAGLPVLVSDRCGCAPDLVVNGRNGFTFDPWDEAALTARLWEITRQDLSALSAVSREIIAQWPPRLFGENLRRAVELARREPIRRGLLTRPLASLLARR